MISHSAQYQPHLHVPHSLPALAQCGLCIHPNDPKYPPLHHRLDSVAVGRSWRRSSIQRKTTPGSADHGPADKQTTPQIWHMNTYPECGDDGYTALSFTSLLSSTLSHQAHRIRSTPFRDTHHCRQSIPAFVDRRSHPFGPGPPTAVTPSAGHDYHHASTAFTTLIL